MRREAGMPRSGGGRLEALLPPASGLSRRGPPGGDQQRFFLLLGEPARLDGYDVQPAAMMSHDPVQFRQRLDLIDDHLAHLCGAFGGLLRHLQHAAAELAAGGFEFVAASRRPSASCSPPSRRTFRADCLNIASASSVLCR